MPLIFDIKRFALHDGPGIRTTVFFKGCPLRCQWCHNPESHDLRPESVDQVRKVDGKEMRMLKVYGEKISNEDLLSEILLDRVFFEESGGGITFSGGEPLLQYDNLLEMLKMLGKEKIHRVVDTSGFAPSAELEEISKHTDLFLYDLKHMDAEMHKKYTGVDNRLILENAEILLNRKQNVIFRIPLIPGVNDSEKDISDFLNYLSIRKDRFRELHLLPYHRIGSEKYKRLEIDHSFSDVKESSDQHIESIKNQFISCGFKLTIGG